MKYISLVAGFVLAISTASPAIAQGVTTTSTVITNTINRTTTYPNGKTSTGTSVITRSGNTTNFNRSTTLPNGKTTNTTGTTTYTNNGNGSFTGTATRTNRNGEVSNFTVEGQRTRTGDTVTKTGTITNTDTGKQGTFNNSRTCTGGQCSFNRNFTDAQGKNRNNTGTATRNADGNWTGNFNVTRRNGTTGTGSFTKVRNR